ncbi:hypothetical protein NDU88_000590 [Pleurodeles waltl]|uniref:Uncharacterized protein n=1 Tax=Pleurodeles waltl TaxID=8319 RepID=A0AAV7LF64_PLEWA|nr:hypothetical protein NDU88_000590 [Pleurodeles waltl]
MAPQSFRGLVALGDWCQRLVNGPADLPWTSGSQRLVPALGEWPAELLWTSGSRRLVPALGPAELPLTSGSRRLVPALGEWPRRASLD